MGQWRITVWLLAAVWRVFFFRKSELRGAFTGRPFGASASRCGFAVVVFRKTHAAAATATIF